MRLEIKKQLTTSNPRTVAAIPNLAKSYQLLPHKIKITQAPAGSEDYERPSQIDCRVKTGNDLILDYGQARFQLQPVIDLQDKLIKLREGKDVKLEISNKTSKREDCQSLVVKIQVDYVADEGGVIYHKTFLQHNEDFEKMLSDVHSNGLCTRLIIKPENSEEIESLDIVPTFDAFDNNGDGWLCSLAVEKEEDKFDIDFTDSDLIEYSRYLEYFTFNLNGQHSLNFESPIHVIAYGYP